MSAEISGMESGKVTSRSFYAHSIPNANTIDWQLLVEHGKGVCDRSSLFGEAFSSSEMAGLIGRLHDIGKARKSFQDYLKNKTVLRLLMPITEIIRTRGRALVGRARTSRLLAS